MSLSELEANCIQDWLDQDGNRSRFVPVSTSVEQANEAVASAVLSYISKFKEVVDPYKQPALLKIACHYRQADIAMRSGWLLHTTTPWNSIGVDMTPEQCSNTLAEFYRLSWEKTKASFATSISKKNLDAEAKEVFFDALLAHQHKLYRAVPRLLFPEIERITREHHLPDVKKTDVIKILSKHLEQMTVSELHEHGGYDVHGLSKLSHHIYHEMWEDRPYPEAQIDPVPNRHAAIHGFVIYSSSKSSFNMLATCELIYAIISALNSRDQDS